MKITGIIATFLLISISCFGQVSHPSRFYDGIDSLFFEILWKLEPNEKLQVAVNKFTDAGFQDYQGGFYLKDRSCTENTWENIHQNNQSGRVSIKYYGQDKGDGGITAFKENDKSVEIPLKLRFEVTKNSTDGDFFNIYRRDNDGNFVLMEEAVRPTFGLPGPIFKHSIGNGWGLIWNKRTGYKVGDYWDVTTNPYGNHTLNIDYEAQRGSLRKVNTVRVRTLDEINQSIIRDSVYIIGFGAFPYSHPILFVTANDFDVAEVLLDYDVWVKVKKNVYLNIITPDGNANFYGKVEWKKAAGVSRYTPNSNISLKTLKKDNESGFEKILFEEKEIPIQKLKFRVGGSGYYKDFSSHEIALKILQDDKLKMLGGVRNTISTWFLNGSYWSLGFSQEKPNRSFYSYLTSMQKTDINLFNIEGIDVFAKKKISKEDNEYFSEFTFDKEGHLLLDKHSVQNILSENKLLIEVDSTFWNFRMIKLPIQKDSSIIIGNIKKGKGMKTLQIFHDILYGEKPIEELINIDLWCAYFSIIHFGSMDDIFQNNNLFSIDSVGLLFPIILDFDKFGTHPIDFSNWHNIFENDALVSGGLLKLIIQRFKESEYAMKRLALVYEDLLNTSLKSERTVAIVENMEKEVMPYYTEKYLSWGGDPNGGISPDKQVQFYKRLKSYYKERPDSAFLYLADYLLKDENYTLNDRSRIDVIFDSIPSGIVEVKLNSLKLDSNFSGLYFPKPTLQLDYKVKDGYKVYVKEFPEYGNSFEFSADKPRTITFLLRENFKEQL
ncbi:MAG: hypothetical protein LC105_07295 [Chitinophagales bacterium]|nr:hypothetical protein [Chitinophagales bacterium]